MRQVWRVARALAIVTIVLGGGMLLVGRAILGGSYREFEATAVASRDEPLRVLFVGNSYTYVNELPGVLAELAASSDPPVALHTARRTGPGWTLERHLADDADDDIRSGGWDVVVLQEQSRRPITDRAAMRDSVLRLHDAVAAAGARTVLFMTWAPRDRPGDIEALAGAYRSIAGEIGAAVAPVGRAWQAAMRGRPELQLHAADGSHPSPLGTYLAATVLYAMLTGRSPVGLSTGGLAIGAAESRFLQEVAAVATGTVAAGVDDGGECSLGAEDRDWIQRALDGWEVTSRDFLGLDPRPLPWTVMFDDRCVWHLAADPTAAATLRGTVPVSAGLSFAGLPVVVRAKAHDGAILLPSGSEVPARQMAFSSLFDDGRAPFFVVALLDVWRAIPEAAATPDLDEIILAVVSHEIVHTRQLVEVGRRVEDLQARYPQLPEDVTDDIVEERFAARAEFAAAFEAERDLLYRAVREPDAGRRRQLAAEALEMARARRARFFTGDDVPYADLEALFLNMEGVAEWAKLELEMSRGAGARTYEAILEKAQADSNDWVQSEALALFLLIDDLMDGWQPRALDLASPFDLLEEALWDPAPRPAR